MLVDPTGMTDKIKDLLEKEDIDPGTAVLVLCNLIGLFLNGMSPDEELRQEGAEYCSTLIQNSCEDRDLIDGLNIRNTRH